MNFKYKFASIIKIKQSLEKKAQKEVAVVDLQIDQVKLELEKLQNILKALRINIGEQRAIKAAEIHHIHKYEEYLANERKMLEKKLDDLEKLRIVKLEDLQEKQKEHKMFETMEGKHFAAYTIESNRLDQISMDEIASQKFSRAKVSQGEAQ